VRNVSFLTRPVQVADEVSDDACLGWKSPVETDSEDSAEYFSPNTSYDDLHDRIEHALANRVVAVC